MKAKVYQMHYTMTRNRIVLFQSSDNKWITCPIWSHAHIISIDLLMILSHISILDFCFFHNESHPNSLKINGLSLITPTAHRTCILGYNIG